MPKEIEPKQSKIIDYLKLEYNNIFKIPEYQRAYSWTINQCDKLFQDIDDFHQLNSDTNQNIEPYFFGTIIIDCSEENKFNLIDGQQRTITFLLLFKALELKIANTLNNFKKTPDSEDLYAGLTDKYNKIFDTLYKTDGYNRTSVKTNWSVNDITIIESKSINENYFTDLSKILKSKSIEDAEKAVHKFPQKQKDNKYTNFFKNFKFFYEQLSKFSETTINAFVKTIIDKCQVIVIKSWNTNQAIEMFNSLNSTGLPLSDADIISAKLYSNINEENKDSFENIWKDIIEKTNNLSSKKIVNIDSILQEYMYIKRALDKEYISENESIDVTTPGLRNYYTIIHPEILQPEHNLCVSLDKIADIWEKIKEFQIIKLLLKFNDNIKLYIISYLFNKDIDSITNENITQISECLIRLFTILELVDAGYSSKNFKTFLFRENIKLVDKNSNIEDIISDFDNHINNNWQNTEDFKTLIKEYNKNILVYLNEYLYAKENNKEFYLKDNVNIEHIMPNNGRNINSIRENAGVDSIEEFNSIVNSLGNKILLEENINKSIGNNWFQENKQNYITTKEGYRNSEYNIANSLVDYKKDTWEVVDIKKATDKIANRISKFIFNIK